MGAKLSPVATQRKSIMRKVKVVIRSFEEGIDVFTLGAYGFEPEHEAQDPDYCKDAPDFDDFEVPGIVLPALIGKYGEPSELVGRVFEIKLP